jgi:delta(3,5)-delta(2,4)-dienoyl-CoA isomerase
MDQPSAAFHSSSPLLSLSTHTCPHHASPANPPSMWINLRTIFTRLSHDAAVRTIVLTGAGDRAFTAGLDVNAASEGATFAPSTTDAARKANGLRRHILDFQDCITAVERCEKPVIALLHGVSYGLALDLSLACDIRVAARNARFSVKEVDIGIAADIGTLSRLPHAVGNFSWVKEVALSARIFDAEEAMRVGLVSAVYQDKKEGVLEVSLVRRGNRRDVC